MNATKKVYVALAYSLFLFLLNFIKLSFMEGTKFAFFSLSHCIAPVSGFFTDSRTNGLIFVLRATIGLSFRGITLATFLLHIPTFGGALYLSSNTRILRMGIPLLCILLFLIHPVGNIAWFYSIYWALPLLLGFTVPRSIFLRSLASTLTTHAIGTILWLYSHTTDILFWQTLFWTVWLERLIIALCMTSVYYALSMVTHLNNKIDNGRSIDSRVKAHS